MRLAKTWFVCVAIVLCVACVSYWTAQANMESYRQEAFMMKACVDAGGEWSKTWNRIPSCLRPERKPHP